MEYPQPTAAYIHVPFCAHHCGYCDFAVTVGKDHQMDLYLEALSLEMARLKEPQPVDTLFIGGGTPTYLHAHLLDRLLSDVSRWLPLRPDGEFSIESTPDSIDVDRVKVLSRHGVNRVSLGIQSFHSHLLKTLERTHEPGQIPQAVGLIAVMPAAVSLDLIFGVPQQSLEEWDESLQRALELQPDHISTYGLTYEKGTLLWKQRQAHQVVPLSDEAELALYVHGMDVLEAAGFEHYEISNFARPGRLSRHNQVYWANQPYHGFGLGAARYLDGCRELNTRSLDNYLRRVLAGESPTVQAETLKPRERAIETLALQLRRSRGISRSEFEKQTGFTLDSLAGPGVDRHKELGLLDDDGAWIRLTRRGKCVADAVISALM